MAFHLEKIGLGGSLFTLMCCLGFGPVVALVGAVGAGFLFNDAVLAPLLVVFLLVGAAGLGAGARAHRRPWPLLVHAASGAVLYFFTFVSFHRPLAWVGVAGLAAAVVLDVVLRRLPKTKQGGCAI